MRTIRNAHLKMSPSELALIGDTLRVAGSQYLVPSVETMMAVASHSLWWRKVCLDYNLCSLGPVMTESGSVSRLEYVSLSRSERVTEPSQTYY